MDLLRASLMVMSILDCGALNGSSEGVFDGDVDFGAVKSAISGIQLPLGIGHLIQAFGQLFFRIIPRFDIAQEFFWSCRKFQFECKAKDAVDVRHEVQTSLDLRLDLILTAKDVSVVLLESSDAR